MANPLHVVLYHPSRLPVLEYGGTERVVVWLARGLAEAGHRVTLLAAPGSEVPEATLIPIDTAAAGRPGGLDLRSYLPSGVDVVHAHVPLQHPPTEVPFVWTFHGNGAPGRVFSPSTIALSADHARRHNIARWVHNGLDPTEYRFTTEKGANDLFLGRLHSAKGWRWAVKGARALRRPLIVAGGWRPTLRTGLRFVGKVANEAKAALLAEAACLWMPAQWDEPFGLTTIEAMVSGTPVLGTRRGALPEIITPTSGLMGNTLEELIEARPKLDSFDPEQARANVLERFTHRTMAAAYERIYRETMNDER